MCVSVNTQSTQEHVFRLLSSHAETEADSILKLHDTFHLDFYSEEFNYKRANV